MKWFNDQSIRSKLLVGFGLMLACLAIVMATTYTAVSSIMDVQAILFHVEFPHSIELIKFRNSLSQDRMLMSRVLRAEAPTEKEENIKDLLESDQKIQDHFQRIIDLSTRIPGMEKDLQQLGSALKAYIQTRDTQVIPAIREDKNKEAQALTSVQMGRYEKMVEISYNLSKISEANDRELISKSEQVARRSNLVVTVVGIVAICLSCAVIILLIRSIAMPIKNLSKLTERVAYGDLRVEIPSEKRSDEVGTLQFMFGMMVSSLRQITLEIRTVIEALAEKVGLDAEAEPKSSISPELLELGQKLRKLIEEYKI